MFYTNKYNYIHPYICYLWYVTNYTELSLKADNYIKGVKNKIIWEPGLKKKSRFNHFEIFLQNISNLISNTPEGQVS